MRVLVACEYSGTVRDAFLRLGHDAILCDILPTESPGPHIIGDVLEILDDGWDLMIAHPPCTYLCNSGVKHLYHVLPCMKVEPNTGITFATSRLEKIASRWSKMVEASDFFNKLKNSLIPRICVENPIPHKHSRSLIGKYDQIIQPWQFGHGETKATCLWLKGLPKLKPTNIVSGRESRIHKLPPSKDRGKIRSKTYTGIAEAMATQWSNLNFTDDPKTTLQVSQA